MHIHMHTQKRDRGSVEGREGFELTGTVSDFAAEWNIVDQVIALLNQTTKSCPNFNPYFKLFP